MNNEDGIIAKFRRWTGVFDRVECTQEWIRWRAHNLFWHGELEMARWMLAWASLIWAVLLFWPGDTFARPTYTIMGKFAPELSWAFMYLLSGCVGLYSVFFKIRHRFTLVVEAILGCTLWTSSCIAMLLSVYPPPAAISAEIVAAITSWWILVRYPSEWAGGRYG